VARNIVIATGSEPVRLFSGNKVVTSRELLEITTIPDRLVIIGGGVTGLEFSMIFQLLGSRVTIIEARERLLPDFDADISAEIEKILKRKGITVRKGRKPQFGGKLILDGQEIPYDTALVAVGRKACSQGLGGIRPDTVNDRMQTEDDTIYAVGDVTGRYQLAHVATIQGIVAAGNIMGEERRMDYGSVPSCIYTLPEIASVGISETADHDVYKSDYAANARARCSDKLYGFLKIVVHKKTGLIEGVHIVGEHATDLIATAVIMVQKKMTISDMKEMIFPHPTFSELFVEAVK
jgi:dihydrolipoamide dehydrogenase